MIFLTFIVSVTFLLKLSQASQTNTSAKHYNEILKSLRISEQSQLNFTTLDILLKRLHLDDCDAMNTKQLGCGKVSPFSISFMKPLTVLELGVIHFM